MHATGKPIDGCLQLLLRVGGAYDADDHKLMAPLVDCMLQKGGPFVFAHQVAVSGLSADDQSINTLVYQILYVMIEGDNINHAFVIVGSPNVCE